MAARSGVRSSGAQVTFTLFSAVVANATTPVADPLLTMAPLTTVVR